MTQGIAEQRIVGSGGGALTTLLQTPVTIDLNVKQQAIDRKANGPVTSVTLVGMVFETTVGGTTAGSMVPFDFIQSVQVYIESVRTNSSLARQRIAVLPTPPGRIIGFGLSPDTSVNLLPFFDEGARLVTTATGTLPTKDVTFTGNFTVKVKTL